MHAFGPSGPSLETLWVSGSAGMHAPIAMQVQGRSSSVEAREPGWLCHSGEIGLAAIPLSPRHHDSYLQVSPVSKTAAIADALD